MEEKKKRHLSLRQKMVLIVLPVVLLFNLLTLVTTVSKTRSMMEKEAKEKIQEASISVGYEISAIIQRARGLLENVKTSVEKSCHSDEEIQDYIYGVADAYLDLIPAGIYAGLESDIYIDKMWQPEPEDGWVMKERPWYIDGLKAEKVTFGETYMDANTQEYIISGFSNIRNEENKVIGVICADIELAEVNRILTEKRLYDNGYVYAVDRVSNMVFSNSRFPEQNGETVTDLNDDISKAVSSAVLGKSFGTVEEISGSYVLVEEVPDTNFAAVLVVSEEDVSKGTDSLIVAIAISSIAGTLIICAIVYAMLWIMLKPIKKITGMVGRMHSLDLTGRTAITSKDELGEMSSKVDGFADALGKTVSGIGEVVRELGEKAESNEGTASALKAFADRQSESAKNLESAVAEMSASIEEFAVNAGKLSSDTLSADGAAKAISSRINDMGAAVEKGSADVSDMAETMDRITTISGKLMEAIENMKDGIDGIRKMTDAINAVASQTNLLSLNASIEAARAGEMGKGFAVVAGEIRLLADQAADSAVNIVKTVKELDRLMGEVSAAADENVAEIREGSEAIAHTKEAFDDISGHMQEISGAVEEVVSAFSGINRIAAAIADEAEAQSGTAKGVLGDCGSIAGIAEQVSAEGNRMEDSGRELQSLAAQLGDTVGKFRV